MKEKTAMQTLIAKLKEHDLSFVSRGSIIELAESLLADELAQIVEARLSVRTRPKSVGECHDVANAHKYYTDKYGA